MPPNQPSFIDEVNEFLIVGERPLQTESVAGVNLSYLGLSVIFGVFTGYSTSITLNLGGIWYAFTAGLGFAFLVYLIQIYNTTNYIVTKYRLIIFETLPFLKFLKVISFNSFRDIHYESVESITIGPPMIDFNKLWQAMLYLAIAWLLSSIDAVFLVGSRPLLPMVVVVVLLSSLKFLEILPFRKSEVRILLKSGKDIALSYSRLSDKFVQELVYNCRTYVTFGAD